MSLIKPYRKVARSGKIGLQSKTEYEPPDLPKTGGGVRKLNTVPPQLRRLVRRVGRQRADRIWEVQTRVRATIPEAIAYAWLEDWSYSFDFQSSQLGGLHVRGGAVVDFVIYDMSHEGNYIWRVQGEHWHGSPRKEHADQLQKERLLGLRIGGAPVVAVVDLWEDDLYDEWPRCLELAQVGEEIRLG